MTQEHTAEPWKIGVYGMVVARGDHGGIVIADVPRTDGDPAAEANARRIVACVNALAGISTEAIEGGVIAELVEALKAILEVRVNKHADNIWTGSSKCQEIARNALAKLEASK